MKIKNGILAMGVLLVVMSFVRCSSVKKTTTEDTVKTTVDTSKRVFKQTMRTNITTKDSVALYTSDTIKLKKNLGQGYNYVSHGVIYSIDSLFDILKTVSPYSIPGIATVMDRSTSGQIYRIVVSFSINDVTSYLFTFYREDYYVKMLQGKTRRVIAPAMDPASFVLDANATLMFRNVKYPVTASVTTANRCRLLVEYNHSRYRVSVVGEAEGRMPKQ